MTTAPPFSGRKDTYEAQWSKMAIRPDRVASVDRSARLAIQNKARYQTVAKFTGVPWFVIAILHMREASGSFAGVLHNGEHIIGTGRKTTLVPKGRGPFSSWEAAAIDALWQNPISKNKDWDIAHICYGAEGYNGWGYAAHGKPSAYLWAGTSIDQGGKYVADGKWDANAHDAQNGCMAVLKAIMDLDHSVLEAPANKAPVAPAPAPAVLTAVPNTPAPAKPAPKSQPKPDVGETHGGIIIWLIELTLGLFK